jgi:hypothetical protein
MFNLSHCGHTSEGMTAPIAKQNNPSLCPVHYPSLCPNVQLMTGTRASLPTCLSSKVLAEIAYLVTRAHRHTGCLRHLTGVTEGTCALTHAQ